MLTESLVREAYEYGKQFTGEGRVADYIPRLGQARRDEVGITVCAVDGQVFQAGDAEKRFSIQSISKVLNLIFALEKHGFDTVFHQTRMEPSGDPFNSMQKLSDNQEIPFNPMVNLGALAVTDLLIPYGFTTLKDYICSLCEDPGITMDEEIFESEWSHCDRNYSLAYLLKSKGVLKHDVTEVMRLYTQLCSLSVHTGDLAKLGALLASGGVRDGKECVREETVRTVLTIMFTCGLYDGSGEFAVRVGLPGKSGVGGGILAVSPHKMGIGVYSPSLDEKGNSLPGQQMIAYLARREKLHLFE